MLIYVDCGFYILDSTQYSLIVVCCAVQFSFYKLTLIYGKQYQLKSPDPRLYCNFSASAFHTACCLQPLRFSSLEDRRLCFRLFVLEKCLETAIIFIFHASRPRFAPVGVKSRYSSFYMRLFVLIQLQEFDMKYEIVFLYLHIFSSCFRGKI